MAWSDLLKAPGQIGYGLNEALKGATGYGVDSDILGTMTKEGAKLGANPVGYIARNAADQMTAMLGGNAPSGPVGTLLTASQGAGVDPRTRGGVTVPANVRTIAEQTKAAMEQPSMANIAQAAASGAATGAGTGTSQTTTTTPTAPVTRTSLEGAADRAVAAVPGAKEYAEKNAFNDRMAMRNLVQGADGKWYPTQESQDALLKSSLEASAKDEAARLAQSRIEDQDRENRFMRMRAQEIQDRKMSLLTDAHLAAQAGRQDEARSLISLLQASGGIAPMDFAAATRAQTEQGLAPQLGMKYAAEAEREKALAGTAPMTAEKILAETDRQRAEAEKARTEAKYIPEALKAKGGVSEKKEVSAEAKAIRDTLRRLDLKIAETEAGAIPNPQLAAAYKKQRENQMILLKKLQGEA